MAKELPASVQQRLVVFATQVDQSLVTYSVRTRSRPVDRDAVFDSPPTWGELFHPGFLASCQQRKFIWAPQREDEQETRQIRRPALDPESALHRPARRGHIADEHCPAARLRGPAGRLVRALRVRVDFRTIAEAVIMVSRVAAQPICLLILNPADSFKKNHLLNCFANR
ncbi:unnamed protein product, partial [Mesorhabditis spiculigera]